MSRGLCTNVIKDLSGSGDFTYQVVASYTPDALGITLSTTLRFTKSDTPWYYHGATQL